MKGGTFMVIVLETAPSLQYRIPPLHVFYTLESALLPSLLISTMPPIGNSQRGAFFFPYGPSDRREDSKKREGVEKKWS